MKKLLSGFLAAILIISMSIIPTYAADKSPEKESLAATSASENIGETDEEIAAAADKLEAKYGVSIKYPKRYDGSMVVTMNNLTTLDMALSTMTPGFVKQISAYYAKKNGRKLEFEYHIDDNDYSYNGGILMAAFEPRTSKVYIFMPSKAGRAFISGENPIALVHEVGHAFHLMCMDLYGESKMTIEWTRFNGNIRYDLQGGLNSRFNEKVFVSSYATTTYEEDFAETFGHVFARNAPGTGFKNHLSKNSEPTALGRKVSYIEKLISTFINNPSQSIGNLRKIYQTPVSLEFEGITFHGDTLQYIGYPQPKNILKGILNGLGLKSEKSTWLRSLGAWRVIATDGNMYYIFPGGAWAKAKADPSASSPELAA